LCKKHKVDVAGIEFVTDKHGERFVYDFNLCSNYNSRVEKELPEHKLRGMQSVAQLCEKRVKKA